MFRKKVLLWTVPDLRASLTADIGTDIQWTQGVASNFVRSENSEGLYLLFGFKQKLATENLQDFVSKRKYYCPRIDSLFDSCRIGKLHRYGDWVMLSHTLRSCSNLLIFVS